MMCKRSDPSVTGCSLRKLCDVCRRDECLEQTGSFACVSVSCCSAVRANARSVIDVSPCRVQHKRSDFFSGGKESPINQL